LPNDEGALILAAVVVFTDEQTASSLTPVWVFVNKVCDEAGVDGQTSLSTRSVFVFMRLTSDTDSGTELQRDVDVIFSVSANFRLTPKQFWQSFGNAVHLSSSLQFGIFNSWLLTVCT